MTYGENTHRMRTHLADLLRAQRSPYQQRLLRSTTDDEKGTYAERVSDARLVLRYRTGVLTWCLQAATAASLTHYGMPDARFHPRADINLTSQLQMSITNSAGSLPTLDDLTTVHRSTILECWRQAARAAAVGEHDLHAGAGHGSIDIRQAGAVLRDAAEITWAVTVLDRHNLLQPGWEGVGHPGMLRRAARACLHLARARDPDYSVDLRGWRPTSRLDERPDHHGIAGVVQAEYNLLVRLIDPPSAANLKRILDSQAELSGLLARRVQDRNSDVAAGWQRRGQTYLSLLHELWNLDGRIGHGGAAAAEGHLAVTRMREAPHERSDLVRAIRDLDRIFVHIDNRVRDILDLGIYQRIYLAKRAVQRLSGQPTKQVHRPIELFEPIDFRTTDRLNHLRRDLVARQPPPPSASREIATGRETLRQAIRDQPVTKREDPSLGL